MKKKQYQATGTIFYHEDDFCQVEIVPRENLANLLKELNDISGFITKNGSADLYLREENRVGLWARKIHKTKLEKMLSSLGVEKHTEVMTGYGSNFRLKSNNTIGFGGHYSAVYFDYENDTVRNIWITDLSGLNHEKAIEVLCRVGKEWDLIMVDWNSSKLIDLSDPDMIKEYIR